MYNKICTYIPEALRAFNDKDALNASSLHELRDAFRVDQLRCKAWLLNEIDFIDKNSSILVIGSWLGFTSYSLYKNGFSHITETDLDPRLEQISSCMNGVNENFVHLNKDINDVDISVYDVIINTSCEHISNNSWFDNIKSNTIVALQSTNFKCDDHINTVESIDEMKSKYSMSYLYDGELKLTETFTRYMIIGRK